MRAITPTGTSEPWVLVVIRAGQITTHRLPPQGRVSIGRSDDNDIAIEDPAISRRHVVLHLGEDLLVEDAGSANGTLVCLADEGRARHDHATTVDVALTRVAPSAKLGIGPGTTIKLGSTSLIIRRAGAVDVLSDEFFATAL